MSPAPSPGGVTLLTGGAATVGSSRFRFPSATGGYDGDTGAFRASFAGGVRFVGHRGGGYRLDLTLGRPTVRISGGTGTLYLDVTSKAKGTGTVTTSAQVPFASLSLAGIDMRGGGSTVVLADVPATLTAQGARSFAGYYTAGTPLDPVSLSADVKPAASPTPAEPSSGPFRRTGEEARAARRPRGRRRRLGRAPHLPRVRHRRHRPRPLDADRRRPRRRRPLPLPRGEGTYDEGELRARFRGTVRFTGRHGLDLRLAAVEATVHDGAGTLYADVTGRDFSGRKVPLVTFAAQDFTAHDGLARLTEAPARLTAEGARAFGGMYQAGTEMDLASSPSPSPPTPACPPCPTWAAPPRRHPGHPYRHPRPGVRLPAAAPPPSCPLTLAAASALLLRRGRRVSALRRRRARRSAGQG